MPDRLPGPLGDSWIAGKHPSVIDRQPCRANPQGQPAGSHAGRTFVTREPAPVVQLVVQSPCRDQYELAESLKNTGQRGGDFTSRVRHSSHRYPQNA